MEAMDWGNGILMAASFELILDTTAPDIQIIAPSHTTPSVKTDIRVKASEKLGNYQEFYFIDAAGFRHDVTLTYQNNEYYGSFYFNDFPTGILTFYARVKDEVNNISALESVSINLLQKAYVDIEINSLSREVKLLELTRMVELEERVGRIEVNILNG